MQQDSKNSELSWFLRRNWTVIIFLLFAAGGMYYLYISFNPEEGRPFTIQTSEGPQSDNGQVGQGGQQADFGNVSQKFPQSPGPLRIALVAGHQGSDSGAVCDDGLQEVQINEAIASKTQVILETAGLPITIFGEFDGRINGFKNIALISLHSDSCKPLDPSFSGFKTTANDSPQSDLLKTCIEQNYASITGLSVHETTITDDMTHYHAFRNVSAESPALLLEMGFMYNDRELLTAQSDTVAQAIANGVLCFIQSRSISQ